MKLISTLFFLLSGCLPASFGQSTNLFDNSRVSRIFIDLPTDSLQEMLDHLVNDYYYHARFVFDDGTVRDTVQNAGLRLRGNTSLGSQKKSFKISFNAYEAGREYQGVRKLNLNGSHNDPTMIREKLFYDVWEKTGMPLRRVNFVELYINGLYRGLYTNAEEIDKQWLTKAFGDNDGNLYKCTWPADLVYLGDDAAAYKAILNNPETRAYDLVTNETADDYTRLVDLIQTLNQPVDGSYADNLNAILNVQSVLKSFALDVATGNWDDYFVNKNNYYLYDNPVSGRFEFITYDTDNTFGVDWVGSNWAKRNSLQWHTTFEPRPLATQLLAVPAYFSQYVHYLDSITRYIVHPDSIFNRIDFLHLLVTPAAESDLFRTLDYGYTIADFHNGFTQTIDGHTPYGIKPFLQVRHDSTTRQLAHLVSGATEPQSQSLKVAIYPNPFADWIVIESENPLSGETFSCSLEDMFGRVLKSWQWQDVSLSYTLPLQEIPDGIYRLHLQSGLRQSNWMLLKTVGK